MKLKYLILRNFGPFRKPEPISLESNKSVTGYAFFADNGRGKTSIYNALRWCLFGEVRERAKTVSGNRFEGSIRPIVGGENFLINSDAYDQDDVQMMSVMLIAEGAKGKIQIQRTAESNTTLARTDEDMEVALSVTVGKESFSGTRAQEAIDEFFPKELERFFFIDGEALEEYTEMMRSSSVDGLQDDVNAVLRIPSLTRGVDDLSILRQGVKSSISKSNKSSKNVAKSRDQANIQKRELQAAIANVDKLTSEIEIVKSKLSKTNEDLKKHSEFIPIYQEIDRLNIEINLFEAKLSEHSQDRVEESKVAWKVLIWQKAGPMYEEFKKISDTNNNRDLRVRTLKSEIETESKQIEVFDGICTKCQQPVPDLELELQKMKDALNEKKSELEKLTKGDFISQSELYQKLGDLDKLRPPTGAGERIKRANKKWLETKKELESKKERLQHLNSRISQEGKQGTEELRESKGRQEAALAQKETRLKQAKVVAAECEKELRRLEKLAGSSDSDDTDYILDDIMGKLIVAMKNTIADYREQARVKAQTYASEVFLKLTNAKDAFSGISLDRNFRSKIMRSKGGHMVNPSSGMVSMMTISVIDALRRVSNVEAPVFLDTPGRSLDYKHKEELLNYFWQNDGHQFLIFAHSGEFDTEETLEKHADKLAKAWSLSWPGDHIDICYACGSKKIEGDYNSTMNICKDCDEKWDRTSTTTMIRELKI